MKVDIYRQSKISVVQILVTYNAADDSSPLSCSLAQEDNQVRLKSFDIGETLRVNVRLIFTCSGSEGGRPVPAPSAVRRRNDGISSISGDRKGSKGKVRGKKKTLSRNSTFYTKKQSPPIRNISQGRSKTPQQIARGWVNSGEMQKCKSNFPEDTE